MQLKRPLFLTFVLAGLVLAQALSPGTAAAETGATHTVQSGDTLASIAESHGVTIQALVSANGIADPDLIRTGQRLVLPPAAGVVSAAIEQSAARGAAPGTARPAESTLSRSFYTVKPGQTLSQIANELDVSAGAIARLNGITDPDLIRAGTQLRVPAGANDGPAASTGQGTRFVASISDQRCWLYVDDQLVGNWRCSTGRNGAPTVPGSYRIQSKINPAYASTWDFWMPYWLGIYYAGGSENGIHGLPYDPETGRKTWEGLVGTPITYGCIMLDNVNARKVYEVAYIGMPVIVLP